MLLLVPDQACLEVTQLSLHYPALPSQAFTQNKAELFVLSRLFIVSRCPNTAMSVIKEAGTKKSLQKRSKRDS